MPRASPALSQVCRWSTRRSASCHPTSRSLPHARDGAAIQAGTKLMTISGNARAILGAERVGLNYLGHLSGIATATATFAQRIAHTKARVVCTRKTTPGLRALEKYAVRCGGGFNHRFGLDDAILIKDNHVAVAGGIKAVLKRAKQTAGHLVKIEIEVDFARPAQGRARCRACRRGADRQFRS